VTWQKGPHHANIEVTKDDRKVTEVVTNGSVNATPESTVSLQRCNNINNQKITPVDAPNT
jgi:hypothetical protein